MKILFVGGGSGGHTMPIIAIARELKKISPNNQLYYIGPKGECALMAKEGLKTRAIAVGKIRKYFSLQNITDVLFNIPFGFIQSFFLLLFIRPKLVFSKGGTGSLPLTYCAKILKIPVFMHESDMFPGKSNQITSKWAKRIFTSFEKTVYFDPARTTFTGNPIRKELLGGNRQEAKKIFNLTLEKPVILILGGSQGAQVVNDFILPILNNILLKYEIIHVAGPNNYKKVKMQSEIFLSGKSIQQYYHLREFLDEAQLKNAYEAASAIVSRAGSGSIFEIAAIGKPCILIPLASAANDHQSKNAYEYAKSGAGIVIEQENLSPSFFMGEISNVLSRSEEMRESAMKFAKPDAAEAIAKEILKYLTNYEYDRITNS